jgi:hypothetical protein
MSQEIQLDRLLTVSMTILECRDIETQLKYMPLRQTVQYCQQKLRTVTPAAAQIDAPACECGWTIDETSPLNRNIKIGGSKSDSTASVSVAFDVFHLPYIPRGNSLTFLCVSDLTIRFHFIDSYVQRVQPRIGVPFLFRNKIVSVLYSSIALSLYEECMAAISLENARLFSQLKQRNRMLEQKDKSNSSTH